MNVINAKFQWFKLFFLLPLFFTMGKANGDLDLITIKKINHTLCVTNDYISPFFINPPFKHSAVKPSKSPVDGWQVKNSNDSYHKPINDSRFEGLETSYGSYIEQNLTKSLAISLYTYNLSGNIKIYIDDIEESMDFIYLEAVSENYWTHFSIIVKHEKYVYFYQDGTLLRTIENFNPKRLIIMTETETFYKVHDYQFYYSDTPSTEPTEVSIPDQCSLLYYSLCSSCRLNMYVTNSQNYTFSGTSTEEWQVAKLHVESSEKFLKVLKIKDDNDKSGFWEFEFRSCSKIVNNAVIYEFLNGNGTETSCHKMYSPSSAEEKQKTLHDQPECDPGVLGNNCDIKCEDILGPEKIYCQDYKICVDSNCVCPWGSEGDSCNKQCEEGKWGLGCSNSCSSDKSNNYYRCDIFTGETIDNSSKKIEPDVRNDALPYISKSSNTQKDNGKLWIGVIFLAGVISLSLFATRTYLKNKQYKNENGKDEDQKEELV